MDNKSSGMSRLVSFFIQDDEKTSPTPSHPVPSAHSSESNTGQRIDTTSPTSANGVVDKKFADHFEKLLEQSNQPGSDYFEFRLALRNMSNLGFTEEKLYQATYATFQALGGTKQALLDTAQLYIKLLRDNQIDFEQQVKEKTHVSVESKIEVRDALVAANQQAVQQILDLQAKIEANNQQVSSLNEEITVESSRIMNQQNNYQATLAQFVGSIEADMAKIKQHLGDK